MQNQHHNIDTNQSYISHGSSAGNQSITTLPNLIGNIQQLHNDQNINQVDLQEHTQGNINANINSNNNNNNSTGMGMSNNTGNNINNNNNNNNNNVNLNQNNNINSNRGNNNNNNQYQNSLSMLLNNNQNQNQMLPNLGNQMLMNPAQNNSSLNNVNQMQGNKNMMYLNNPNNISNMQNMNLLNYNMQDTNNNPINAMNHNMRNINNQMQGMNLAEEVNLEQPMHKPTDKHSYTPETLPQPTLENPSLNMYQQPQTPYTHPSDPRKVESVDDDDKSKS